MGSYLFSNQYQNVIIPDDEKRFKSHWLRYYKELPEITNRFVFVDPAIGQKKHHDYTGIAMVDVSIDGDWYLRLAQRDRLTPTQIVEKIFELNAIYKPNAVGIEIVAYQEALLYLMDQEMRRRNIIVPVKGIKRNQISKETRILGLVPRFEWGRIFVNTGMLDFEDEYTSFPRGKFDDILDSLASLEEIVFYPEKKIEKGLSQPHSPHDPNYERWVTQTLVEKANEETQNEYE